MDCARTRVAWLLLVLLSLAATPPARAANLSRASQAAWDRYARLTEARIERELKTETTARPGPQVAVERLQTMENGQPIEPPDAMIHHWKGSVFIPAVTLERVLKFAQDYDQHSRCFQEVEKSRLVLREGDKFTIFYRLKRTKVITVRYNTDHTVVYRSLGPKQAASRTTATRIAELDSAGSPSEHEKAAGEDRGFLWRLNSYWRFTERDGGVIAECESISLSRAIPSGLGWLVGRYVESIPRESLVNTLSSLSNGVRGKN